MVSLTTMPRLQCRPARSASSVLGRMPTAITTRSAGTSLPSLKLHGRARGRLRRLPTQRRGLRADHELRGRVASSDFCSSLPAAVVELALHQPRHQVHHGDVHAAQHQAVGGLEAEQAAADHHRVLVRARRRRSSRWCRRCRGRRSRRRDPCPGTGRMNGLEPVASSRRSYGASVPSSAITMRAMRSIFDDLLASVQRDAVLRVPVDIGSA